MASGEKRRFSRVSIEGRAHLQCGAERWDADVVDLSLRGALISRPQGWPGGAGDGCSLRIELGEGQICIEMDGTVAHVEENSVGLRCEHIGLESISHLKRMVELNLGDPDLLERELGELVAG